MKTILLLDDDSFMRETLALFLRYKGPYCVLEAADQSEAVRLCGLHKGKIELLVAAVMIGVRRGTDVPEQLKKLCPALPVPFISGYSQEYLVGNGILQSGDACLAKPFTPDKLLRKVGEVLQSNSEVLSAGDPFPRVDAMAEGTSRSLLKKSASA